MERSNLDTNINSVLLDKTILLELVKQATVALSTIQQVASVVFKTEAINNNQANSSANLLNSIINNSNNTALSDSEVVTQPSINSINTTDEDSVGTVPVTTALKNIQGNKPSNIKVNNCRNCYENESQAIGTCITNKKDVNLQLNNINLNKTSGKGKVTKTLKIKEEVGIVNIPNEREDLLNNNYVNNYYNNNNIEDKNTIINNNNTIIKPKQNRMEENNNYEYNYYNKAKSNIISNVNYNRQGQQSNKKNIINTINKKPEGQLNKKNTISIINKQNTKMDESENTKYKNQANVNVKNISKKRKREEEYHYHISKQTYLYCKYCDNYGHTKTHCKAMVLKAIDQLNIYNKHSKNTKITRRNSDSCIMYNQEERITEYTKEERITDSDTQVERIIENTEEERIAENTNEERITDLDTQRERIVLNTQEEELQQQQQQKQLLLSESQKEQEEMFKLFFATTPNKAQQIPNTQVQKKKGGSDNNCDIISEHKEEKNITINSGLKTSSSTTTKEEELINKKELNSKVKDIITTEDEDKIKINSGLKSTTSTTTSTTTAESPISNKSIINEKEEPEVKEEIKTSGLNQTSPSTTVIKNNIYKNEEDLENNNYTSEEDLSEQEDVTWPGISMSTEQAEAITEKIVTLFPEEYRTKRWLYKTYLELKIIARDTPTNNTFIINRDLAERLQLLFEMESLRC